MRELRGDFGASYPFCPAHPTCALLGSNLDCTVAMLVVRCYCLPGNPDKLRQHVVGHCPAAESDYVVAQAGRNRTQDLIPIPYCGHIARNNNQLWFYPVSNASPDHNGATPKPIPFDNTGIGKAFSATSVHTTSTICAIESEPRLVRKKNSSPLPHLK